MSVARRLLADYFFLNFYRTQKKGARYLDILILSSITVHTVVCHRSRGCETRDWNVESKR